MVLATSHNPSTANVEVATDANSPTPTRTFTLAADPTLTAAELPMADQVDWVRQPVAATEGECELPLSTHGYAQVAFNGTHPEDSNATFAFAAASVAGQEASVAAADKVLDQVDVDYAHCSPSTSTPEGVQPRLIAETSTVGDRSQVWRVNRPCTPPTFDGCEPIAAYAAVARVGRVLVSVTFSITGRAGAQFPDGDGGTAEVSRTEGERMLQKAVLDAVSH